jgi:hypothetical protein
MTERLGLIPASLSRQPEANRARVTAANKVERDSDRMDGLVGSEKVGTESADTAGV